MRKELWFGFTIMGLILIPTLILMPWTTMTTGHYGLLMLALVVVAIMMGFPTAFTLMGMGMIFAFIAYRFAANGTERAAELTLALMVQRAYSVMTNDVLISIPLFVFMGYLVERANLIEKLFRSLHLALARVPGSLAVATLVTCAIFATATGIVGAVVTLMGLLAMPAMLRAGYNVKLTAGAITAGGCLGILIPPSVMLIVYGATAGVSVVQLYAGAFFPGLMLAGLYILYVVVIAWLRPEMAPPLSAADRAVAIPDINVQVANATGRQRALTGLMAGLTTPGADRAAVRKQLGITLLPAIIVVILLGLIWNSVTTREATADYSSLTAAGGAAKSAAPAPTPGGQPEAASSGGLAEPPTPGALSEPPTPGALSEPPTPGALSEPPTPGALAEPPAAKGVSEPPGSGVAAPPSTAATPKATTPASAAQKEVKPFVRDPAPTWFWIILAISVSGLALLYLTLDFKRLEIFKMLLASFFPLTVLILAVLGSIVFGLATPTEAAAIGSLGGFILAAIYMVIKLDPQAMRKALLSWLPFALVGSIAIIWFILFKAEFLTAGPPKWIGWLSMAAIGLWCIQAAWQAKMGSTLKESTYLTAKTSAMVCWLFVGSSIFSAAFALLGGQDIIEKWVLSLGLTPIQFLLLSQVIIFILGWPLEWTEIIVIFMPIFIPLLAKFNIDPLFFGLLVALNLQTAFLSPPVAMAAFYLKGVSPPHVTLNQIFVGMLPFMGIQVFALFLLYMFPGIGLWLPQVLYK
jgi:TRAP-type mannitol/chloroaromatic compound transport system permease large subunit